MAEFLKNAGVKNQLKHTLWIGGAPDSGKSTVAQELARRYDLSVYHYDREDAEQVEKLAKTVPEFRRFMDSSLEDRWILTPPAAMFEFLLKSFAHRFPLVIERILELPKEKPVLVEGFGLLPELVQTVLSSSYQAIWLIPTETFKWASMLRRGKPSFAAELSDPEIAKLNLFKRDMLLADYYHRQTAACGLTLFEIDGTCSIQEVAHRAVVHFSQYLDLTQGNHLNNTNKSSKE